MCGSIFHWASAGVVTLADLAVLIPGFPFVCPAWGANRRLMAAVSVLLFVLAKSLANLWKAALRSLRGNASAAISPVRALSTVAEEGDCNV